MHIKSYRLLEKKKFEPNNPKFGKQISLPALRLFVEPGRKGLMRHQRVVKNSL